MKKEMRLRLIRKLVSQHEITNQEDLRHLLYQQGLNVTQATLSRDIHELKLFKVRSKDGGFKYSIFNDQIPIITEKLQHKMKDDFVSMEVINHFVIIKTLPGNANSFGALLDSIDLEGKIGTICGDDVCMIICRTPIQANKIKQQLEALNFHSEVNKK
ncbi:arginine repressor [Neobacillus drentensis]|uniref:arginine repressor n=1 Tax=Neobacillus drentensis TaxID=220684 RepID=UPI001F39DE7E|nr:arginine repressor [Neobacillus drentensis]ULT57045.1 arginine repressor [Neobacillus drentensis]